MYADDTPLLNIGQDINEHQKTTSENTGLVQQYFKTIYLYTQPKHTTTLRSLLHEAMQTGK
jgi:hypothetical protein